MAEKSFTFIEKTESDNGALSTEAFFTIGEIRVGSVKELVDVVLAGLGKDDCVKRIGISAHGGPGDISVGNGISGVDRNKSIALSNAGTWTKELSRLRCKFCKDSEVAISACNVGSGRNGAKLLFLMNQTFRCATRITAPTGKCNPFFNTGETQVSTQGDTKAPPVLVNPDAPGDNKKRGKKAKLVSAFPGTQVRAGAGIEQLVAFDGGQVLDAHFLPRVLGLPFGEDHLATAGCALPSSLLTDLRTGLEQAEIEFAPRGAYVLDGLLQLQVLVGGVPTWVAPWGLLSEGAFVSVLREDTTLLYGLPPIVAAGLFQLLNQTRAEAELILSKAATAPGLELSRIDGVDLVIADRMRAAGLFDLNDLRQADGLTLSGVSAERLGRWRSEAALLADVPTLDPKGARLLVEMGLKHIDAVAQVLPELDASTLREAGDGLGLARDYDFVGLLADLRSALGSDQTRR